MELVILAVGVVAGVTLVVCLVHFTGGSKGRRFSSSDQALAAFQENFPELTVQSVHVAKGRRDALVMAVEHDVMAHLKMLGSNPVIRLLGNEDIARMKTLPTELAVVIPGDGLSAPATVLQFDDRAIVSEVNLRTMRKNSD